MRRVKPAALNFPNPSRSYDEIGRGVHFWGYDRTLEISFFLEEGALSKVHLDTTDNEAGFLNTFDANRERICEVASNIYARRQKPSYILTSADF
jgi:hypothetical protein